MVPIFLPLFHPHTIHFWKRRTSLVTAGLDIFFLLTHNSSLLLFKHDFVQNKKDHPKENDGGMKCRADV
jgi:hypothetical protein